MCTAGSGHATRRGQTQGREKMNKRRTARAPCRACTPPPCAAAPRRGLKVLPYSPKARRASHIDASRVAIILREHHKQTTEVSRIKGIRIFVWRGVARAPRPLRRLRTHIARSNKTAMNMAELQRCHASVSAGRRLLSVSGPRTPDPSTSSTDRKPRARRGAWSLVHKSTRLQSRPAPRPRRPRTKSHKASDA